MLIVVFLFLGCSNRPFLSKNKKLYNAILNERLQQIKDEPNSTERDKLLVNIFEDRYVKKESERIKRGRGELEGCEGKSLSMMIVNDSELFEKIENKFFDILSGKEKIKTNITTIINNEDVIEERNEDNVEGEIENSIEENFRDLLQNEVSKIDEEGKNLFHYLSENGRYDFIHRFVRNVKYKNIIKDLSYFSNRSNNDLTNPKQSPLAILIEKLNDDSLLILINELSDAQNEEKNSILINNDLTSNKDTLAMLLIEHDRKKSFTKVLDIAVNFNLETFYETKSKTGRSVFLNSVTSPEPKTTYLKKILKAKLKLKISDEEYYNALILASKDLSTNSHIENRNKGFKKGSGVKIIEYLFINLYLYGNKLTEFDIVEIPKMLSKALKLLEYRGTITSVAGIGTAAAGTPIAGAAMSAGIHIIFEGINYAVNSKMKNLQIREENQKNIINNLKIMKSIELKCDWINRITVEGIDGLDENKKERIWQTLIESYRTIKKGFKNENKNNKNSKQNEVEYRKNKKEAGKRKEIKKLRKNVKKAKQITEKDIRTFKKHLDELEDEITNILKLPDPIKRYEDIEVTTSISYEDE